MKTKPAKYAVDVYSEVNGDIKKFISKLMSMGKSFELAERQYYLAHKCSYNRYA